MKKLVKVLVLVCALLFIVGKAVELQVNARLAVRTEAYERLEEIKDTDRYFYIEIGKCNDFGDYYIGYTTIDDIRNHRNVTFEYFRVMDHWFNQ